ncbi:MAG: DUF3604 domain-containing protein [Alphaproteobacteria bacterium]|nr:DUF3604 domain-containing protein [Alphaproteobacteria bacterium]
MPHSTYLADQMGHAALDPTGTFEAGSYGSFTLVYTAGPFGIDDSGGIKISFRTTTDMGKPQFADPKGRNYTTAEASNGAALHCLFDRINIRPWVHTLYIRLIGGFLRAGEQITVRFGDRRRGSEGIRLQTNAEVDFPFKIYVDAFATYDFVELPASPSIGLVPGPVAEWRAIMPTLRRPSEAFRLAITKLDRWGNPGAAGGGAFALSSTLPVKGLPDHIAIAPDEGARLLDGLSVDRPGDLVVTLTNGAGDTVARSNPLRVAAGLASFWADFHGQSGETVGSGSARDYFAFARDQALLDIVGHQGNDFQITEAFWDELNRLTREFHEPGRFVTMPGYEWSGNTGVGGDRNVFFRHEGRVIHRSSHALVMDGRNGNTACHTATDLFAALAGEEAVTFAHVGGRYADIAVGHDGRIERSVEIHSTWGTFEWLLHDAFRLGYRVGVVCNSDDHKGRPGLASPGASLFGAIGGLTCVKLRALTRDAVFEALRRRHHYGTTGIRLHLDLRATFADGAELFADDPALGPTTSRPTSNAGMGDIVRAQGSAHLTVEAVAPAPVERIDVFRGPTLIATRRPFPTTAPSRRLRVIWEGAEYRGRGRQVIWDGDARISGNRALRVRPVNFLNPERRIEADGGTHLRWTSLTTGNLAGMELWLDDPAAGEIDVATKPASTRWRIADIGYEDLIIEAGGLGRRLRAYRLPEENAHFAFSFDLDVAIEPGHDNPFFVRVTLEDGHQAWSSPLYVIP